MQHWYTKYYTLNGEWPLLLAHDEDGDNQLNSLPFASIRKYSSISIVHTPLSGLAHNSPQSPRWAALAWDAVMGCAQMRTRSSATLLRVHWTLP